LKKREFTSFDVAAVVHELKKIILDARISNIYQLDAKTLLFKLHKPDNPAFRLVLEAGKRLHLTFYVTEKPLMPPAFCMALRKQLRNGRLVNIEQHEFERVVVFTYKTRSGVLRLVLELFGDGNMILMNEKDEILHALVYRRMRDRNIIRGEVFDFAPPSGRNPFKVSLEQLQKELKNYGDVEVVRALARALSIGGLYAEEVLLEAGISKTKPTEAISDSEFDAIFNGLQTLLSRVARGSLKPYIVVDEAGGFIDVAPFKLMHHEEFKHQPYGNFNEALDEFYVRIVAVEKAMAGVEVEDLKREAERLRRVIESQEKVLVEAETKAEHYKRIGDIIYAHAGELQVLLNKFSAGKKEGKKWDEVVSEVLAEKQTGLKPSVFFESFDAKGLVVNMCLDGLRFSLGLREKLFDEAGQFYEHGKRARRKLEGAKAALEETRRKLKEVKLKTKEAETLERAKPTEALKKLTERKVKRKEWFEKFRWFVSSEGLLVVAGKDAVSNEVLVKKYAEPEDIVFHADIVGAPFVILKTGNKEPSERVLYEASEFAGAFSRGWQEGFGSVDVYWVKPNQLSKGGPSGEYVPHGAFVVIGKRNWARGVPLKLAVGVIVEPNGEIRFLGGPADAVKEKTKAYVVIVPGDTTGKELSKRILKTLAAKIPKEHREKMLKATIEEIRGYIPYNKGRILEQPGAI